MKFFDHEKLQVYQRSVNFVEWTTPILEKLPKAMAVQGQLDRASTSIPLNLAEGNGKYTSADRCRFFDIARGSALECAACLDVTVARKILLDSEIRPGKELLLEIVSMIVGLIKNNSPSRLHEDSVEYKTL